MTELKKRTNWFYALSPIRRALLMWMPVSLVGGIMCGASWTFLAGGNFLSNFAGGFLGNFVSWGIFVFIVVCFRIKG
jgi:hypothetical protein